MTGLNILDPVRFHPGLPRNTKTTFGWFFFDRLLWVDWSLIPNSK